jgi:hypothetical protein
MDWTGWQVLIAATAIAAFGGIALMQEQNLPCAFLFYSRWRIIWLFVVQRTPCAIDHG